MKSIKDSNFDDFKYDRQNISTFPFKNNFYGDLSSLSIDEDDSYHHYHDSYNGSIIIQRLNDINQSIEESFDNSINEEFFPEVLNVISNNQSFLHSPIPIFDINNNILKTNINDKINKKKDQPIFMIQKRTRKTNKDSTKKSERKYDDFNIKNKIQGYYSNILIELDKSVCKTIGREDLIFHPIKRKYKVENSFIKKNKENKENKNNKTIEEFFINNNDENKNLCQKIRDEEKQELIDILGKNYLFFFKKIFFAERKEKYHLKDFDLADIEIEIPNTIKLFSDLLEDNKYDQKYVKLLKESARRNFLIEDNNISFKCKKCRK